jgi:phage major head subunit gpT-like protein
MAIEITPSLIRAMTLGFKKLIKTGAAQGTGLARRISSMQASNNAAEVYALDPTAGRITRFRGEVNVSRPGPLPTMIVENEIWTSAVAVSLDDVRRDRLGVYSGKFEQMGLDFANHPDELLAHFLIKGFSTQDYTNKFYFDTDKPLLPGTENSGKYSNKLTAKLSPRGFDTARQMLLEQRNADGKSLRVGYKALLIVGPKNEALAKELLQNDLAACEVTGSDGVKKMLVLGNDRKNTAEYVVCPDFALINPDAWFLVAEDRLDTKPFILQTETELKTDTLAEGTENYVIRREIIYSGSASYNLGYFNGQLIIGSDGTSAPL